MTKLIKLFVCLFVCVCVCVCDFGVFFVSFRKNFFTHTDFKKKERIKKNIYNDVWLFQAQANLRQKFDIKNKKKKLI